MEDHDGIINSSIQGRNDNLIMGIIHNSSRISTYVHVSSCETGLWPREQLGLPIGPSVAGSSQNINIAYEHMCGRNESNVEGLC